MNDREKVIKGILQHCEGSMFDRCGECPYYEIGHEPFVCRDMLLNDLNELLKEQEETISKREAEQRIGDLICIELKGRCPTWDDIHRALYD